MNIFFLKSCIFALHMMFGQDVATQIVPTTTDITKIYECPRCRRSKPPGSRKRPSAPIKRKK